MLKDVISTSITTIENKKNAQSQHLSLENYCKALSLLSQVTGQLSVIIECMNAIKQMGISNAPILSSEMRDKLLDSIQALGTATKEYTLTKESIQILEAQIKMTKNEMESQWKIVASKYAAGTSGYLYILGGLTAEPKKAEKISNDINDAIKISPSKATMTTFIDNVATARKLINSFALVPEIEEFLTKIKLQQATIEDLTPKVMLWLKENNLTRKLNINF